MGYNLGLKLVRGAYMNEERLLAKENNAESPICETLEDTHSNYDTIMTHAIKNV
jgi:proline dehydrogenase